MFSWWWKVLQSQIESQIYLDQKRKRWKTQTQLLTFCSFCKQTNKQTSKLTWHLKGTQCPKQDEVISRRHVNSLSSPNLYTSVFIFLSLLHADKKYNHFLINFTLFLLLPSYPPPPPSFPFICLSFYILVPRWDKRHACQSSGIHTYSLDFLRNKDKEFLPNSYSMIISSWLKHALNILGGSFVFVNKEITKVHRLCWSIP